VQKKLEMLPTMMDCLYAKCIPIITDCVMAELEKLGPKYRIALRIARDERWERLKCDHKGVYADDCIVDRVMKHKIYIAATNDRDLKRRIRKIPGVPIMSVARGKYVIERLPDAPEKWTGTWPAERTDMVELVSLNDEWHGPDLAGWEDIQTGTWRFISAIPTRWFFQQKEFNRLTLVILRYYVMLNLTMAKLRYS
jgi:rRNA-processing protein FCF1